MPSIPLHNTLASLIHYAVGNAFRPRCWGVLRHGIRDLRSDLEEQCRHILGPRTQPAAASDDMPKSQCGRHQRRLRRRISRSRGRRLVSSSYCCASAACLAHSRSRRSPNSACSLVATARPGTNFGNACWGDVYNNTAGEPTQLLHTCPYIGEDVIACQQTYGKKIFLSIGGGNPSNYYIKNALSGQKFANFLWAAFGPVSATQRNIPRPWGDAGVDGFDFDTENIMSPAPQSNYMTSGYAAMINHLKNDLFPKDTSKPYYISGAPQCVVPDEHFTAILKTAWFDFVSVNLFTKVLTYPNLISAHNRPSSGSNFTTPPNAAPAPPSPNLRASAPMTSPTPLGRPPLLSTRTSK